MIKILLNYDVKKTTGSILTELKQELIENYKYSKVKVIDGHAYELPTTMLYKEFDGEAEKDENKITNQSQQEFLMACKKINAEWERYNVISYNVAIFGDHQRIKK